MLGYVNISIFKIWRRVKRRPCRDTRYPVSCIEYFRGNKMTTAVSTPLVRLGNLFPNREVYAKCEFLSPSGSFKDRGAAHLLTKLGRESGNRLLVVPSMGNTALGAAVAAKTFGFSMVGVVPQTIGRAKDMKLQALGVELV